MKDAFGVERSEISKAEGYGWTSKEAQKREAKKARKGASMFRRGPDQGRNARNVLGGAALGSGVGAGIGAGLGAMDGVPHVGAVAGAAAGGIYGASMGSAVNVGRENSRALKRNLESGDIKYSQNVSPWTGRIKKSQNKGWSDEAKMAAGLSVLPIAGSAYQSAKAKKGRKNANFWRPTGRHFAEQAIGSAAGGAVGGVAGLAMGKPQMGMALGQVGGLAGKVHAGGAAYKNAEKRGDIKKNMFAGRAAQNAARIAAAKPMVARPKIRSTARRMGNNDIVNDPFRRQMRAGMAADRAKGMSAMDRLLGRR